jgi:hypothetical protein
MTDAERTETQRILALADAKRQWRQAMSHALPTSPAMFIGPAERARQLADTIPGVQVASDMADEQDEQDGDPGPVFDR